jgi:hypothetical protein
MDPKVDIFGAGSTPFGEVELMLRARVRARQPEDELVVNSPEDIVLRKLLWFREGGEVAGKHWRDVVELLRVSAGGLTSDCLDLWAERFGLTPLLARARAEARG